MRRGLRLVAAALASGLALIATIGFTQARSMPVIRYARLSLAGWPHDVAPLRIALLSDLHSGGFVGTPARLRTIVAAVNRTNPDVVLLAGDFVNGHDGDDISDEAAMLVAPLSALRPRLGTVAVLGNHDYWTSRTTVTHALKRAGVTVLANAAIRVGPLAIVGVDDDFSGHADPARAMASAAAPMLAASHAPDVAFRTPTGVPLLAGHTHCGQVTLPVVGALSRRHPPVVGRRLYDPRLRCGATTVEGHRVIVTAGIGSGALPLRIGAPPDWWVVDVGR